MYVAHKSGAHLDPAVTTPDDKLAVFCTMPSVPSRGWNLVTEAIGTSGWHHAWVPVVAPLIGGVLGGFRSSAVDFV